MRYRIGITEDMAMRENRLIIVTLGNIGVAMAIFLYFGCYRSIILHCIKFPKHCQYREYADRLLAVDDPRPSEQLDPRKHDYWRECLRFAATRYLQLLRSQRQCASI